MTHYRDPLAGLRAQVAMKRGLVEHRAREIPPLLRAMLPSDVRDAVARAARIVRGEVAGTQEALARVDAALEEALAAYEKAVALVPRLRECPSDVPDPPRPKASPPWLIEERGQLSFRRCFEKRIGELSPSADVVRFGDFTYLARMHVADAPLTATARGRFNRPGIGAEFVASVRTSAPRDAPALDVRTKRTVDDIAVALRIARDDATGDAAFDSTFLVDGPDGGVHWLAPHVTRALGALVAWAPRLTVRKGIIQLSWRGWFRASDDPLVPDEACDVVLGARAVLERG